MVNTNFNGRERRLHARIEYPPGPRPVLVIGEDEFEVEDISEKGIKFITEHPARFNAGLKEVQARIIFADRKTREIRGAILRIERSELSPEAKVAIFLYDGWGISPERIEKERKNKDG